MKALLKDLDLTFEADAKEVPQAVPYGSLEESVWGK